MSKNAKEIVELIVDDLVDRLVNDDGNVNGEIATTNATGFGLDTYEIESAEFSDNPRQVNFKIELIISGEQDQERPFSGSTLRAVVSGNLETKNGKWQIKAYHTESCSITDF